MLFFFFKQKTAYEMRISDWSSDVCSSDLQKEEDMAPAAHDPSRKVPTIMTTADMAMKVDPEYRTVSERFRHDHEAFTDAWARAWFKLTHRDMVPKAPSLVHEAQAADLTGQAQVPPRQTPTAADEPDTA